VPSLSVRACQNHFCIRHTTTRQGRRLGRERSPSVRQSQLPKINRIRSFRLLSRRRQATSALQAVSIPQPLAHIHPLFNRPFVKMVVMYNILGRQVGSHHVSNAVGKKALLSCSSEKATDDKTMRSSLSASSRPSLLASVTLQAAAQRRSLALLPQSTPRPRPKPTLSSTSSLLVLLLAQQEHGTAYTRH
jgi:hypothetical protein